MQLVVWPTYAIISIIGVLPYVGLAPHLDSVRTAVITKVAFAGAGFVISGVLRGLYQAQLFRRTSFFYLIPVSLACCYLAGLGATVSSNWIRYSLSGRILTESWSMWFGGALNASAFFLAWSAAYFAIYSNQRMQQEKQETLRATALAQQAQLELLRSQVNPHFLFNSLNSIQALISEDPKRAQTAIEHLAGFLRYSLTHSKASVVTVAEEMAAMDKYLSMERIRFEDKLCVSIDVRSSAEEYLIPSLLFQPLIENALKYGLKTSRMPLEVRITAARRGEGLWVEIANTGRWVTNGDTTEPGSGLGLRLVRERLRHYYPTACLTATEMDGWVRTTIEIGSGPHQPPC